MSKENVESLRAAWDVWMAGNLADLSLLDDDVVYEDTMVVDHAETTYHGHEGVRKAWTRWTDAWEIFDTDLEWLRDAGDHVVTAHRAHLRGKASGVETEVRYAYVWRFERGKITSYKSYRDPAEALSSVGLRE
jgi:ketosteroid isomerase-like protein